MYGIVGFRRGGSPGSRRTERRRQQNQVTAVIARMMDGFKPSSSIGIRDITTPLSGRRGKSFK